MAPHAAKPDPLLLKPSAVARLLGLSVKTTRAMVARRELPSVRLGGKTYVVRAALEALLQQLPGTSTSEALANLGHRALIVGLQPEVVETDDTVERK